MASLGRVEKRNGQGLRVGYSRIDIIPISKFFYTRGTKKPSIHQSEMDNAGKRIPAVEFSGGCPSQMRSDSRSCHSRIGLTDSSGEDRALRQIETR